MPKRTLAALGVVLAFAAVLVVVPASTDSADAHPRTKTVQRCSYDPFAGQQCWTETVSVSHVHRCGAGMTGSYPNCYPIPPANQPVCPVGMTGTPPNCHPPPPANTQPPPPATTEPPPPPTTAAPPPPTTAPPPPPTAYVPPTTTTTTTAPPECPAEQTGTPPNCKTGRDTTRCATGYHRNGSTCHPNHGDPPCGTGLWTPHVGHTPQQRPACEDDKSDGTGSGTEPSGGSAYGLANLFGKLMHAYDNNKDTLAEPDQALIDALTDAAKSKAARDAAETVGREALILMEKYYPLIRVGGKTISLADAKAAARTWQELPPEARIPIAVAACLGFSTVGGAAACGLLVGFGAHYANRYSEQIKPYLEPMKRPEPGSDSTDKDSAGCHPAKGDTCPDDDNGDANSEPEPTPTTAPPSPGGDDSPADDAPDDNSAGSYCGPWASFAFRGRPDRGGVTLFVNGAAYTQYQSSYDNREWAAAQCQAALASLGR